jgi:hypothetical protein
MKKLAKLFAVILILIQFLNNVAAQNVNIPDPNFKSELVGNTDINTNGDSEIQVSEAEAFTGNINCSFREISNLEGIQFFVNIKSLDCSTNKLTVLDVSQNTKLTSLDCTNNKITTLVINPQLTSLSCNYNLIDVLDVSNGVKLTRIDCKGNQLSVLDLSANPLITDLDCSANQLTSLVLRDNIALVSVDCSYNSLDSLDVSHNLLLTSLYCSGNQLSEIDVSKNTHLNYLNISGNILENVNLSQNTQLLNLNCDHNSLTQLDLINLTKIEKIYCAENMLINLDVSKNTALYELWCESNNLRSLNVQNGNNSIMEEFHAQYNDSLNCIQVDDPTYSTQNWTSIDTHCSFSSDCNYPASNAHNIISKNILFYPNPATSEIHFPDYSDVAIFNLQGRKLEHYEHVSDIDISQLPSGIYVVETRNRTQYVSVMTKLVKL